MSKSEPKNVTPATTDKTLPGNLASLATVTPTAALAAPMSFADFEKPETGEVIGGSYLPIEIAVGTVSPLLKYLKETKLNLPDVDDKGAPTTKLIKVPVAENIKTGRLEGLPISAIFKKHWDEANVQPGDTFVIGRYPDVKKKTGKGGGSTMMQVHAIKMISRVSPVKELTAATA